MSLLPVPYVPKALVPHVRAPKRPWRRWSLPFAPLADGGALAGVAVAAFTAAAAIAIIAIHTWT